MTPRSAAGTLDGGAVRGRRLGAGPTAGPRAADVAPASRRPARRGRVVGTDAGSVRSSGEAGWMGADRSAAPGLTAPGAGTPRARGPGHPAESARGIQAGDPDPSALTS